MDQSEKMKAIQRIIQLTKQEIFLLKRYKTISEKYDVDLTEWINEQKDLPEDDFGLRVVQTLKEVKKEKKQTMFYKKILKLQKATDKLATKSAKEASQPVKQVQQTPTSEVKQVQQPSTSEVKPVKPVKQVQQTPTSEVKQTPTPKVKQTSPEYPAVFYVKRNPRPPLNK